MPIRNDAAVAIIFSPMLASGTELPPSPADMVIRLRIILSVNDDALRRIYQPSPGAIRHHCATTNYAAIDDEGHIAAIASPSDRTATVVLETFSP